MEPTKAVYWQQNAPPSVGPPHLGLGTRPAPWGVQEGSDPRGATLHQLTPDVWAQIGGKWVFFGHGGREMVFYMGIFLGGLLLYGCVFLEG